MIQPPGVLRYRVPMATRPITYHGNPGPHPSRAGVTGFDVT